MSASLTDGKFSYNGTSEIPVLDPLQGGDIQGAQGNSYQEGDYVEGKGTYMPDGSWSNPSTGYDPKIVSNPTGPSSSSTVNTNNNINTNTTAGTNSANGTKTKLSSIQKSIMKSYGLDEDYVRNLSGDAVGQFAIQLKADQVVSDAAKQAKKDQDAIYQSALSENNSTYAQATADLNDQKEKDLNIAKTTAASLNPYSGPNTDEDNYSAKIGIEYTKLQQSLDRKAESAKAALAAGKMDAYQKINASIATTKATGLANIQKILADMDSSNTQKDQFNKTLEFNKSSQAATQANLSIDNYNQYLRTPERILSTEEINAASDTDLQEILSSPTFSGVTGLTVKQFRQDLLTAAREKENVGMAGTWSIQTDANGAPYRINNKTGAMEALDTSFLTNNFGGTSVDPNIKNTFINGIQNVGNGGGVTEADRKSAYGSIDQSLKNGDIESAKAKLRNYAMGSLSADTQNVISGASAIERSIASIRADIEKLPPDQKTGFLSGNWEKAAEKIGKTSDPALANLKVRIGAVKAAYIKSISGTAFTDNERKTYGELLPDITNEKELNIIKMESFLDVVKSNRESFLKDKIGIDEYDRLFGDSNSIPKGQEQTFEGHTYISDGTQWVLKE